HQWALVIVALLALTLTPLGLIQWRQWQMLQDTETRQVDSLMWQAYQVERELSRLDHLLVMADREHSAVAPEEIQERYEILLSRIPLLTDIPRRDLLEAWPGFESVLTQLNRLQ